MMPFVTIIMPVRNEGDFIRRCLTAVLAQDYPHDQLEVFISDGMSTDNTRAVIAEVSANQDIPVFVIDNPKKIVATGFNCAMTQAHGEIIVRVDGHCEIATDYVRQCVEHLQDDTVHGVGGPIETVGNTPLSETIAIAMSSTFGVGGSAFRTIKDRIMLVDTIAFPAYKRWVMDIAGPLDEELVRNQDDEYNYRLRHLHYSLLLSPHIHSKYYSRSSLSKLWSQYSQYGYWKVRVISKHPKQMSIRQLVPPIFTASIVFLGLLALLVPAAWVLLLLELTAYTLTSLIASFLIMRKHLLRHVFLLLLIFAILHLGYGFGFWRGIIDYVRGAKIWNYSRKVFQRPDGH